MLHIRAHKFYHWLLILFKTVLTYVFWSKKNAGLTYTGSCLSCSSKTFCYGSQ